MGMILLEVVISLTTLITFTLAGISDWKWREISPIFWIAPTTIGVAVNVLYYLHHNAACFTILCKNVFQLQLLQLVLSSIVLGAVGILTFVIKVVGGADFLAITSFTALYPFNRLLTLNCTESALMLRIYLFLPPTLCILIIYSVIMIFLIPFNVLSNIVKFSKEIKTLKMPTLSKIFYIFFCKFMYLEEYRKKKFYYPVYIPQFVSRISFSIYENDAEWKEKLSNVPNDTIIIASWGIPMITFLSLATSIYITAYIIVLLTMCF
jgi:hypothetical protein